MTAIAAVPRATYRLQLNRDFGFARAQALLPYLADLGISHLYLSPILRARAGSSHGYDTIEHRQISPELGTLDEFRALAGAARKRGLGIILDFVPNHMGIGGTENIYWLDVLEHGPASRYAHWFDIDWAPGEAGLKGKVLVPILGCSYGQALADARLVLKFNAGRYAIWVDDATLLPVAPQSYDFIGGPERVAAINADPEQLDALISKQHWRVAHFGVAADEINYRRFFIVNELAGIRIEEPEVFEHAHGLIFQLIGEGLVDGLRIDHVDGLADPKAYLRQLRRHSPRPIYLVVEKILAPHEQLRGDWGVDGTTGYEFSARLTALGTDPAGEGALTQAYQAFTGERRALAEIEREAKLEIIDDEMGAELDRLAGLARAVAQADRGTSDLTRNGLRKALRQVLASLAVYRSYGDAEGSDARDRRAIGVAIARARKAAPGLDKALFDFVGGLFERRELGAAGRELVRRLQQQSGPVMAKGLEDTALYRANRLIAISDVGALPDRFSLGVASFHDFNTARLARFPHAMLTTSSHDSKRGEDTRARIVALSGHAAEWAQAVRDWTALLGPMVAGIDRNELWYFFQMLVGAWPVGFAETGALPLDALEAFRVRMREAMRKSVREARVNSRWTAPDADYEAVLAEMIDAALTDDAGNGFLAAFRRFAAMIGEAGARVGLGQAVLKLTVPGVPDIYQGAELWEQSMMDPDNRRKVDFAVRERLLAEGGPMQMNGWRDGAVKLRVTQVLLGLRAEQPALFAEGSYEPLAMGGRICAFLRRHGNAAMIVAVALQPWRGMPEAMAVPLPDAVTTLAWRELFSGAQTMPSSGALAPLSVAVWVGSAG